MQFEMINDLLLIGYCVGKCEQQQAVSSNEIYSISIEERKTIINKLIRSAKYRFRVCAENKCCRSEPCETIEPIVFQSSFGNILF
ncbi:unnamed protein product [Rotaria sordida]|uniref:Uncharacterized protein n=1 Tax=Rotaria sordida TaxID=392033 RepID=A0A813RDV1_9BILA|nr:unnamed protein product [Rotaria sordida]